MSLVLILILTTIMVIKTMRQTVGTNDLRNDNLELVCHHVFCSYEFCLS